jgi:hypothetical protein
MKECPIPRPNNWGDVRTVKKIPKATAAERAELHVGIVAETKCSVSFLILVGLLGSSPLRIADLPRSHEMLEKANLPSYCDIQSRSMADDCHQIIIDIALILLSDAGTTSLAQPL